MRRYLVAAVVVAFMLPALAEAKGPASATITGKGLERTLTITGDGEALGTQLGALTMRSGYFAQMFGQTPDPTLRARPRGTASRAHRDKIWRSSRRSSVGRAADS